MPETWRVAPVAKVVRIPTRADSGRRGRAVLAGLMAAVLAGSPAAAQTKIKPGFNLFSVEQDVEIGHRVLTAAIQKPPAARIDGTHSPTNTPSS